VFESFDNVEWDNACDSCQTPRAIRLSYFSAKDPLREPSARIAQSLDFVGTLRYGRLFRCRYCGRPWYEPEQGLCTSVERSWLPLLGRWNAQPLVPTHAQVLSMRAIGAVQWTAFGDAVLRVPCRVRASNSSHDPALALLQNQPLLMWRSPAPKVLCVDEVDTLALSEFALPHELRKRGAAAPEKAMGYAPHSAYWGHQRVDLNGLVEFWGADGQMGMDLSTRAARGEWQPRALNPRTVADHPLTYVIGDLTDHVRKQLR
jgi:hypothetical protein